MVAPSGSCSAEEKKYTQHIYTDTEYMPGKTFGDGPENAKDFASDTIYELILDLEESVGKKKDDLEQERLNILDGGGFNDIRKYEFSAKELGIHPYVEDLQLGSMDRVSLRQVAPTMEESVVQTYDKPHKQQTTVVATVSDEAEEKPWFLGKGKEAECYIDRNVYKGNHVVRKKYYNKQSERKRIEFDVLRAFSSLKNIPTVYGTADEDDLCMEYCGPTLRQWSQSMRGLPEVEVWRVFEQLADVLRMLHLHHVIHRDLKPDNMCIKEDTILKLIDFGSVQTSKDTISSVARVTAAYMSPELWISQTMGTPFVSGKADVFAGGLTIGFLLYKDDIVPKALGTNDMKQIQAKMIENPSAVSEYVERTFPLEYSGALKQLLLRTLDGYPKTRISAEDAHKQIVAYMSPPPPPTTKNEDEDIRILGVELSSYGNTRDMLTPSGTGFVTDTSVGIQNFTSSATTPNLCSSQINLGTTYAFQNQQDPMSLSSATSPFPADSTLQNDLHWQPPLAKSGFSPGIAPEMTGVQRTIQHLGIVETVNEEATRTNNGKQVLNENQQSVLNIQQKGTEALENRPTTILNEGTVVNTTAGQDEYVIEEPDRQAKRDVLKKLGDRIKNGSKKRPYHVLPTEFTNLPNMNMIPPGKRRKEH
ncbi:uncharacterized protein [Argopecten irradians]|uniref:uncharacterized protein n=1 Tax=Argopecten irradians TaxID=31199 RepID=UPI00371500B8